MSKKPDHAPKPLAEEHEHVAHPIPVPHVVEPHHVVTSPAAEHLNDRMSLAAKPNEGQPLSHRNRGKAGRKG